VERGRPRRLRDRRSYFDFSPIDKSGVLAPDQGFRRRIDATDAPTWCHADKEYLLAGSSSGELVIGQINRSPGFGQQYSRRRAILYGSADAWPLGVGAGMLFVQRGGRKIRDAAVRFRSGSVRRRQCQHLCAPSPGRGSRGWRTRPSRKRSCGAAAATAR
jgi:hypothetical protein